MDFGIFFLAGLVGGAINTAAGGAKLFVFPMLLASGLPPVVANATGTVALWPAQAPSLWVFRHRLRLIFASALRMLVPVMLGALLGAGALIAFGEQIFVTLVPLFLAIAVVSIAFGRWISAWAARRSLPRALVPLLFFSCGFYGGFFGAGLGFLLLATIGLSGVQDTHTANTEKNLLSTIANTTAVVPLALSGLVAWQAAGLVLVGGLLGGYGGASLLRRVPEQVLRYGIVGMGVTLTVSFLWR